MIVFISLKMNRFVGIHSNQIEPTIIQMKYSRKNNVILLEYSSFIRTKCGKITCDEPSTVTTLVEEGLSLLNEISWK